jgi:peptidoglycan hydrolase CwlO-like protein
MELASFEIFKDYEIDFLERVAENVASLLYNRQSTDKTKKLLEESHKKAQTLAQQEEEMRQNAEELMATQEEMERQRRQLEQEIKELKNKLRVKELLID